MDIILLIIFTVFVGFTAAAVMGKTASAGASAILGFLGEVSGSWLMSFLGKPGVMGIDAYSFLVALTGALLLMFLFKGAGKINAYILGFYSLVALWRKRQENRVLMGH